jgi:hypothetical protein
MTTLRGVTRLPQMTPGEAQALAEKLEDAAERRREE